MHLRVYNFLLYCIHPLAALRVKGYLQYGVKINALYQFLAVNDDLRSSHEPYRTTRERRD
ncbi:hypothetical protein GCM10011450_17250 [Advenella faeciporci]|uniref:Uncharacterized protein n=1 Tax=Advenella faeciporci TaxID=797535 RepID=A0A918JLW8_9BURK|nr:hypothetical protein GCM10011450_17250 [Advenella faeciporci]